MNCPAENWGLPDWQSDASYKGARKWPMARWRWEFLRRRGDLRAEFDEQCEERQRTIEKCCEEILRCDDPGFFVPSYRINPNFPTSDSPLPLPLFNPRISEQPESSLHWNDWMLGQFSFLSDAPPDNYFRVDFDLRQPLVAQIDVAQRRLRQAQIEKHGRIIQRRRHADKWIGYLRTLDARECGASWSEISNIHRNTAGTEQTARDIWEQARELCFNF